MMAPFLQHLEQVFGWLLTTSWQASVLALLVLLIQSILGTRLNPRWRYALWLLVVLRLLLPALPESAMSLFQFAPPPPAQFVTTVTEPWQPLFTGKTYPSPSDPEPMVKPNYPFSYFTLLSFLWLSGAIILLVLTWRVNYRFARQVANSPAIFDPELLKLFTQAKTELAIHRSIRLIENGHVQSPAIMGLFRPTLLLPADVREKFDDHELRFVFLHELAHLKRGDVIVQALIALLQILHWFNPILWFAFRRMRIDREPATDALVLSRTGEAEKERYGLMLIKLLQHFNQRHSLPTLVGILEDTDQFKRRFSLIARFTRGAYGWSLLGLAVITILGVAGLTAPDRGAPGAPVLTFMVGSQPVTNLTAEGRNRIIQELEEALTTAGRTSHYAGPGILPDKAGTPERIELSGSFLHVIYPDEKTLATPVGGLRLHDLYLVLVPDKDSWFPLRREGWFCAITSDQHLYYFAHRHSQNLTSPGALLADPHVTEPLLKSHVLNPLLGWLSSDESIDATLNRLPLGGHVEKVSDTRFPKPAPPFSSAPAPLAVAIANNDYDGAQKLLDHGAEIYDWSIPDAMANHHPRLVRLLWNHAKNRGSELRYEISQGASVAQVTAMLMNGTSAEPLEDDFIDSLGVAAANGDLPMVELLLAHGANPNWRGRTFPRYTALGLAVSERRLDIVTYLLDHGGQPNDPSAMIGALMNCLKVYPEGQRQVSMQIVQLLVTRGALDHPPQNRGIYLYIACAEVADPALVKLLLTHGSNPDDVAIDGQGTAPVIQQIREAIRGKDKKAPRPELQPILALLETADKGALPKSETPTLSPTAASDAGAPPKGKSAENANAPTNPGDGSNDGFIVGEVVNEKGVGIGRVQVRDETSDDLAVTDASGHFAMPYTRAGHRERRILIAATNSGFGVTDYKNAPASVSRDGVPSQAIILKPRNQVLHGKLLDAQGRPVQDARIWVSGITTESGNVYPLEGQTGSAALDILATASNSDGQFKLSLPSQSSADVRISAPGCGTLEFYKIDSSNLDLGTLALPTGGDISGTVVDATTGKPLHDRVVRATRKSSDNDSATPQNHFEDQFLRGTDNDGNFRFQNVRIGTYELEVSRDNYQPRNALVSDPVSVVDVKANATCTIDLSMVQGTKVTGQILRGNTSTLVSKQYAIQFTPSRPEENTFWSNRDGTFTTYLLPGTYQLKVDNASDQFGAVQLVVPAKGETVPVILRASDNVATIKLKVKLADGKPFPPQALMWAWIWQNGMADGASGSRNEAIFEGVKRGSEPVFIVDVPGYAIWHSSTIDTTKSTSSIEVVLQPATSITIRGRIIEAGTNKPLKDLEVSVTEFLEGGIQWEHFFQRPITDGDGRFTLSGLRSGDQIRLNAFVNVNGVFQEVGIINDPSGMFGHSFDSQSTTLTGSSPIQIPDTSVNLSSFGETTQESFDQHPLPPFGQTGPLTHSFSPPSFGGIGAVLLMNDSQVQFQRILPSGVAAKAGIQAGDIFLESDGKPVKSLAEAISWARGPVGTTVRIRIKRGDAIQDFTLTRENTSPSPVAARDFSSEQTGHDIDLPALEQITLPTNPTPDQVRDYLHQIALVSLGQKRSSSDDPQVQMIEKVGADNVGVLLEDNADFVGPQYWEMDGYIQAALENLVKDTDRDLIVRHLNGRLDLMPIIVEHHWQNAAKPTIVAALNDPGHLRHYDWFPVAVAFQDPSLYPALTKTFVVTPNKYQNFGELKSLPGFDLQSAVDEAWKKETAEPSSTYPNERMAFYGMAVVAAQYGHRDALDYLFQALVAHAIVYSSWLDPRAAILAVVDFQGNNAELQQWYAKNKEKLRFDKTQKKFVASANVPSKE